MDRCASLPPDAERLELSLLIFCLPDHHPSRYSCNSVDDVVQRHDPLVNDGNHSTISLPQCLREV